MRRLLTQPILLVVFSLALFGQREDKEGKAWLDACAIDPAALNVTGLWRSQDWGRISLNQREDSRRLIGSGDGWEISGVVSGKTVCLLFSNKGKIAYSARLTAEGSATLTGVYAKGLLSPGLKTVAIRLTK